MEMWTTHRKELEVAIHKEKGKDHADPAPDLLSQEDRLRRRLSKLNMDMNVCRGDGNCLVSPGTLPLCPTLDTIILTPQLGGVVGSSSNKAPASVCAHSSERSPWSSGAPRTSMKVSGGRLSGT